MPASPTLSAPRLAALVAGFDTHPAYAGLAEALRQAIVDGRIPHATKLPSERDLAPALGVSRTTVTRAYAQLIESGCARARQGSGTFAQIPGGPERALDRALTPSLNGDTLIDLNCAAASAANGLQSHYEAAVRELPGYLAGHGYYLAGLPELQAAVAQSFEARGLPTLPEQILITPGALSATAIAARGLLHRGDRVLVETPVYPNAPQTLREAGGRLVPVAVANSPVPGWDLDALEDAVARLGPRAAYLIPDFQNPTGTVMSAGERDRVGRALARGDCLALVDESHQQLALDGQTLPAPLAAYVESHGGRTITVGSASKSVWGGLRIGWMRAPLDLMAPLTQGRLTLDLGVPVLEQLVMLRVLADPEPLRRAHLAALRTQRSALVDALREALPSWRFTVPGGGLALWCELPQPVAYEFCLAAERHGVALSPGPMFAPTGGLSRYVRIPWTRPTDELRLTARHLAAAWAEVTSTESRPARTRRSGRVMVA
ncbi:MAG: PLP-dependent aminotransferase family protein [Nocardioides sp.]